jgi:hypothetical protein
MASAQFRRIIGCSEMRPLVGTPSTTVYTCSLAYSISSIRYIIRLFLREDEIRPGNRQDALLTFPESIRNAVRLVERYNVNAGGGHHLTSVGIGV